MDVIFRASRYGEGNDYLNCPLNREEYEHFVDELCRGEKVPYREFERPVHFEGCLPVEEMAERGRETLAHGPMKPVGLKDPRTGRTPYAVVQLRHENGRERLQHGGLPDQVEMEGAGAHFPDDPRPGEGCFPSFRQPAPEHLHSFPHLTGEDLTVQKGPESFLCRPNHRCGRIRGVNGHGASWRGSMRRAWSRGNPVSSLRHNGDGQVGPLHLPTRRKEFQPMNVNFGLFPPTGAPLRGRIRERPSPRALGGPGESGLPLTRGDAE